MKPQRASSLRKKLPNARRCACVQTTASQPVAQHSACVSGTVRGGSPLRGLLLSGLLLQTSLMHAAARNTAHGTHHAPAQSAGRASAHAVREEIGKSSRHPSKASESASHERGGKAHGSKTHSRHADDDDAPTKHKSGKSHSSGKHGRTVPADDPQPEFRAHTKHKGRRDEDDAPVLARKERHAAATQVVVARNSSRPSTTTHKETPAAPATIAESGHGASGLNASDFLRGTRPQTEAMTVAAAAPLASGVSHPDDDERLPMHAAVTAPASPVRRERPAPIVRTKAPEASVAVTTEEVSNDVADDAGQEGAFPAAIEQTPHIAALPTQREFMAEKTRELREAEDAAVKPLFIPLYNRDGKLVMPAPLKGSHEILVHQNQMADDAGLTRIQDDEDLERMRRNKLLVDFAESSSLHINESLPANRRCARPWTVKFVNDTAKAFAMHFGQQLNLNSAVRTVAYQLRLQRVNGNAAAVDGEGASPHLTGQAIDFGKRGMSSAEIAWMRSYLLPLMQAGKIDVEEEFQQACFHISVYASYAPSLKARPTPRNEVAQNTRPAHGHATASLAVVTDDGLR